MTFDFVSPYTALILVHVIGIIIGGGGAVMSDLIFFASIKNKVISSDELRFLKLGSRVVWVGVAVILLSGAAITLNDLTHYLALDKFLAKMTIVGIIILNGALFHFIHLPRLTLVIDKPLGFSPEFKKGSRLLFASGAISSVSWLSAFILGSLRSLPFSYSQIIETYLLILFFAIGASLLIRRRLFRFL